MLYLIFNIVIFGRTVSLLPNFVGYFIIYHYFNKLKNSSKETNIIKALCISLALYNFMMLLANLFSFKVGIIDVLINIAAIIVMFVLFYFLTRYFTSDSKLIIISLLMNTFILLSHMTSFSPNLIYLASTIGYLIFAIIYVINISKLSRSE